MYNLKLMRHGPKNNNPEAHQTGVEALLDPDKITEIKEFAQDEAIYAHPGEIFEIETTPVNRAIATGDIIYKTMKQNRMAKPSGHFGINKQDPNYNQEICLPVVDELIGSYGINPKTGEAINLSPKSMSDIWGKAKKLETSENRKKQKENKSLYAWAEQGFDNFQASNPEDPGISLREIACRVGAYVHKKLTQYYYLSESKNEVNTIAIGHSGDFEPFLYLCLEMLDGKDGSNLESMTYRFRETGGALEPLRDINLFLYDRINAPIYGRWGPVIIFPIGEEITDDRRRPIGLEILEQQAQWFKEYGKSKEVLEQKLRLMEK